MNFPPLKTQPLYSAAHIRAMDGAMISTGHATGLELMERAGAAALELLLAARSEATTLSAVAGQGNNGGDAYVVARLAHLRGLDVRVYSLTQALEGDAARMRDQYLEAGGALLDFIPEDFEGTELLIDGLFGTGLNRPIEGPEAALIMAMNRYRSRGYTHTVNQRTVLALDLPSGLDADRGHVHGVAVEADLTLTFVAAKAGLFTAQGPAHVGEVSLADLGLPHAIRHAHTPCAELSMWPTGEPRPRSRSAHKGCFGHVLVVGGAPGFGGAARLAGEAALRVGAGRVSLATHPTHAQSLGAGRPELMIHGVDHPDALKALLRSATVCVLGPGLGQDRWGRELLAQALRWQGPLIVDADGLNLLKDEPLQRADWVLTPHPGEAARLLGCDTRLIENDRLDAAERLCRRYGGTVVLKGAGSLIASQNQPLRVIPAGNPGLASGGMGDVLSGVIAGLCAQGVSQEAAAPIAVLLHGAAADLAIANEGERGLLASDLFPWLRRLVNHPSLFKGRPPCVSL